MERIEDVIQRCIERLTRGASVEETLIAYPNEAPLIEPALRSAQTLLAMPQATASDEARAIAMQRMLGQLAAAHPSAPRAGWFAVFLGRSRAFQAAAVAGGIALFSVAGIGAAAATGSAPEPVREFFGLSDSKVRIEFEGIVVSVEPSANSLDVSAGGAIRTVIVNDSTELSDGGDEIQVDDFTVGDVVEVKGSLQADGTVLASRVHLEDDDDAPTAADRTAVPHDDDDDNRGHGNDEDGVDEDNPGRGGPGDDDDAGEDDDRGHGNDDDGDDEDNSGRGGPGNDDDAGEDDDRGHGNDGDGDDEDNPGLGEPGEGDDDGHDDEDDGDDDEDNNSGHGGGG
jgi:hypothetical protein